MVFVKRVSLLLFGLLFCADDQWVARAGDWVLYESEFYARVPKSDWDAITDKQKKEALFFGFLKKQAAVKEALGLGLNYSFDVIKKLSIRKKMLLVNEYYMRHFLGSVVPPSSLIFCKNNLKKEVFVKHILIKQGKVSAGAIKDSLLKKGNFNHFAKTYSEDSSVSKNGGSLGWLSLGQTVPEFESVAFDLCVGCVAVAETDFGSHVVLVDSVRDSRYVGLPIETYNDFAFRFSTAYIEEDLKILASEHDSMLIRSNFVFFDRGALRGLVGVIKQQKKEASHSKKELDVLALLKNYSEVLVSYNGELLSGAWFANELGYSLKSSVLSSSVKELELELVTVLLRNIAFNRALDLGLNKQFTFSSQFIGVREAVLEKAYLKHLIESVSLPTKKEVSDFFASSDQGGRNLDVAYNSIEAVLLKEKQKQIKDSFFASVVSGSFFDINKGWLYD